MPITYDESAITSPGGRANNQDHYGSFRLDPESKGGPACWIVADGLGGHRGGETASQTVVSALLEHCKERAGQGKLRIGREELDMALKTAQSVLMARKQREMQFSQMHTTVVLLVTDGMTARWAHVGDSRLYHFRDKRIIAQTEDHSVPAMLCRTGEIKAEKIRTHQDRNLLLRSLGSEESFQPEILPEPVTLQPSDAFLLCTDGFWEYVLEKDMEADLKVSKTAEDWVERMKERVLAEVRTKAHKEHDNYTALAVMVEQKNAEHREKLTPQAAMRCDKGTSTILASMVKHLFAGFRR